MIFIGPCYKEMLKYFYDSISAADHGRGDPGSWVRRVSAECAGGGGAVHRHHHSALSLLLLRLCPRLPQVPAFPHQKPTEIPNQRKSKLIPFSYLL